MSEKKPQEGRAPLPPSSGHRKPPVPCASDVFRLVDGRFDEVGWKLANPGKPLPRLGGEE